MNYFELYELIEGLDRNKDGEINYRLAALGFLVIVIVIIVIVCLLSLPVVDFSFGQSCLLRIACEKLSFELDNLILR